ncbi:alpha/beta fold hydrolase [Streptomyces sp. NPDC051218]|uniref:alpha/beta fold hydrolase n=1 Tax=Streptomyces sp. NPDC051218 TaxID=3365645 RepID=UPI0037BB4FA1
MPDHASTPAPAAYTAGLVNAADGVPVATYTWLPDGGRPRAFVQIAHGAGEHALRYDRFARHLTAHGYGVIASDHRGHGATAQATGGYGVTGSSSDVDASEAGASESEAAGAVDSEPGASGAGAFDSWRAIVDDLKAIGDQVRTLHPGTPLFLLGHSMGSHLARDYAQEYPDGLAGLILSGTFRSLPGVGIDESIARLEREIAEHGRESLSSYLPELFAAFNDPYPHRTGFEWLSRDEAEVDVYVADERCGFPFSAGLCLDWVRAVRKMNDPRNLARVPADLPVHIAVGTEDPCNQGMTLVHELVEDYRYVGLDDLTWRGYEGARHEILNETNRDEVQEDLRSWLDKHVL